MKNTKTLSNEIECLQVDIPEQQGQPSFVKIMSADMLEFDLRQ